MLIQSQIKQTITAIKIFKKDNLFFQKKKFAFTRSLSSSINKNQWSLREKQRINSLLKLLKSPIAAKPVQPGLKKSPKKTEINKLFEEKKIKVFKMLKTIKWQRFTN